MNDDIQGLRERLAKQSEETLGKIAQDLIDNPVVSGALTRAFEARERAVQAQEAAMGALNIPSAADIERLTRRLRSVAQRLEGIEDALDRLDRRLQASVQSTDASSGAGVEERLTELAAEVRRLASAVAVEQVPREQERLDVEPAKPAAKPAASKSRARKKPASS